MKSAEAPAMSLLENGITKKQPNKNPHGIAAG
jgi:hypothetical protein